MKAKVKEGVVTYYWTIEGGVRMLKDLTPDSTPKAIKVMIADNILKELDIRIRLDERY